MMESATLHLRFFSVLLILSAIYSNPYRLDSTRRPNNEVHSLRIRAHDVAAFFIYSLIHHLLATRILCSGRFSELIKLTKEEGEEYIGCSHLYQAAKRTVILAYSEQLQQQCSKFRPFDLL